MSLISIEQNFGASMRRITFKLICLVSMFTTGSAIFANVDIPIQHVLQIPDTLESATGVSRSERHIKIYYDKNRGIFPKQGLLEEATSSYLLKQLSYAGLFCERMVAKDMFAPVERRWTHHSVDFSRSPYFWTISERKSLLEEYASLFWLQPLAQDDEDILLRTFAEFAATFEGQPKSTVNVLVGICSLFASSINHLAIFNMSFLEPPHEKK